MRGAKIDCNQFPQHSRTTPRKPIHASYRLLDCPCAPRETLRPCFHVGQTSFNTIAKRTESFRTDRSPSEQQ